MPWNTASLRNRFYQVRDGVDYYLGDYVREKGAHLTQIATAVYQCEPSRHFRQGFGQIFRIPEFLSFGEQTKAILIRSGKTNLTYLASMVLFARLIPALRKTAGYQLSPDIMEASLYLLNWWMTLKLVYRLIARFQKSNLAYALSLARAMENDVKKYLPDALAKGLAKELSEMLEKIFPVSKDNAEQENENLYSELRDLFIGFFRNPEIHADTFNQLQKPLSLLLRNFIEKRFGKDAVEFSNQLANEIIEELAKDFKPPKPGAAKELPADKLLPGLCNHASVLDALEYSREIKKRLSGIKKELQSFLPVQHHPACKCKDTKGLIDYRIRMLSAKISSIFYYFANIAFIFLPTILENRGLLKPEEFLYATIITVIFRMLIVGQAQNEYKAVRWGEQCKADRDRILAGNKAHSAGVGAIEIIGAELWALFVYLFTGVRTVFTADACNQVMSQLNLVGTLGFNDALPGTKRDALNWFYLPKMATRGTVKWVSWLCMPDPNEPKEQAKAVEQINNFLGSEYLHTAVWWIWGKGAIIPAARPLVKDPASGELVPKKDDALDVLFEDEEVRLLLELYVGDIKSPLAWTIFLQSLSTWVAKPVSILPYGEFLKLFTEQDCARLLQRIKSKMEEIEHESIEKRVLVIEEKREPRSLIDLRVKEPDQAQAVSVVVEQKKPPKPAVVMEPLSDLPVSEAISRAMLTDLFSPAVVSEKKGQPEQKQLPVVDDGFELVPRPDRPTPYQQNHMWQRRAVDVPDQTRASRALTRINLRT